MIERDGPQLPEQLHPPGLGTQFTPFGLVPLGESVQISEAMAPAALPVRQTQTAAVDEYIAKALAQREQSVSPRTVALAPRSLATISPASVVKSARARIKELRAFLREAKKAEKELKELERLVDAAKRPLAAVRDIKRSTG